MPVYAVISNYIFLNLVIVTDTTNCLHRKNSPKSSEVVIDSSRCEVDPVFHTLFSNWRQEPTLNRDKTEFLQKIYHEDINPCLQFRNEGLEARLVKAIEENSIWVEPWAEKDKSNVPKYVAIF